MIETHIADIRQPKPERQPRRLKRVGGRVQRGGRGAAAVKTSFVLHRWGAAIWWVGRCPTAAIALERIRWVILRDRLATDSGRWVRNKSDHYMAALARACLTSVWRYGDEHMRRFAFRALKPRYRWVRR